MDDECLETYTAIPAMIDTLIQWDIQLFLWLNGLNSSWLDPFMYLVSTRWFWIPFYFWLAWMIYERVGWKQAIAIYLSIGLVILLADQLSASFFKPFFERIRPCRPENQLNMEVHTVSRHCGGIYGFVSSHATNFFAMATFLSGIWKERQARFIFLGIAALVSYSRIYLGVHFPGDVLGGTALGIIIGLLVLKLYLKFLSTSSSLQ